MKSNLSSIFCFSWKIKDSSKSSKWIICFSLLIFYGYTTVIYWNSKNPDDGATFNFSRQQFASLYPVRKLSEANDQTARKFKRFIWWKKLIFSIFSKVLHTLSSYLKTGEQSSSPPPPRGGQARSFNCSDIISPYQKMHSKVFPLVLPISTNLWDFSKFQKYKSRIISTQYFWE